MAVRLVLAPMVSCRYWVACEPEIVQGLVLQSQVLQILILVVEQFPLGTPLALKAATIALIFTLRFCRARAAEAPFPTAEMEKMAIVGQTFTMALPETLKVSIAHWPLWAWQCMRSTATVTKTRSWFFIYIINIESQCRSALVGQRKLRSGQGYMSYVRGKDWNGR